METCINYTDDRAFVSSDERKMINRMLKLKQQYPDDVTILQMPENNDGYICAVTTAKWIQIAPPRKLNLSDDDRRGRAERMRKLRVRLENSTNDKEDTSDGDAIL